MLITQFWSWPMSSRNPPWKRRLLLPAYQLKEAAIYTRTHVNTASYWLRSTHPVVPGAQPRAALSYFQLIELAVVAAMRTAGVTLQKIRGARDYAATNLGFEFPFATLAFKTDGQSVLLDFESFDQSTKGKFIVADKHGQYAWKEVIGERLTEFEYDSHSAIAIRWHLAGRESSILIDPQISFGAPTIQGIPTWAIRGRWEAGEEKKDIAEDFGLKPADVRSALHFEGVETETIAIH